jgi:DNA-binding MarR family transcriptional regulator
MRFLNVMHALESDSEFPEMDLQCRRVLEEIAVRQHDDQTMTVTEVMGLSHIASPATLHRKLDDLLEMGMIAHHFQGDNRRTKYVMCTPAAQAYFERAGRAMQRTLKLS